MEKVSVKLGLDLGRSGLRLVEGNRFVVDSSEYKNITGIDAVRKDITDKYSDFRITKASRAELVGSRFIKGRDMSFYKSSTEQADNQELKCQQESSYVNFVYMVARAVAEKNCFVPNIAYVNAVVCIPTAEHFSENGELMSKQLSGAYTVKFTVPNKTVSFIVEQDKVITVPEGPSALLPLMMSGENADMLSSDMGVIVDVGYGSADITLVKDGEAQGSTARSFAYGGIMLRASIASALERNNFSASESNITRAIKDGCVRVGSELKPVGDIVRETKMRLAKKIKKSIVSVVSDEFESVDDIAYIFTTGRNFTTNPKPKAGCDTGDLAQMLKEVWGSEIVIVKSEKPEDEEVTCENRTLQMVDGRYPTVEYDPYELANVCGAGVILDSLDED